MMMNDTNNTKKWLLNKIFKIKEKELEHNIKLES